MDVTTSDLGDDFVLIHSHHENRQGFLQGVRKDPVQDPSPHFSRLGGTLDYSDIDSKEYVILHDDSDRQENVNGAPAQPRPLLLPTLSSRTLGVLYRFTGRCSVPPTAASSAFPPTCAMIRQFRPPGRRPLATLPALSMGFEIVHHPIHGKQQKTRLAPPPKPQHGILRQVAKRQASNI